MSLAVRRQIRQLQEDVLPARAQEIAEICGRAVPYTVDWASFGDDAQALDFVDNLACHRVNMALRVICVDDLGREAVRDGLREIAIANAPDPSAMALTFDDGVLRLRGAWAHRTAGMFDDGAIRTLLAAAL
jgi:hypothetical protein